MEIKIGYSLGSEGAHVSGDICMERHYPQKAQISHASTVKEVKRKRRCHLYSCWHHRQLDALTPQSPPLPNLQHRPSEGIDHTHHEEGRDDQTRFRDRAHSPDSRRDDDGDGMQQAATLSHPHGLTLLLRGQCVDTRWVSLFL